MSEGPGHGAGPRSKASFPRLQQGLGTSWLALAAFKALPAGPVRHPSRAGQTTAQACRCFLTRTFLRDTREANAKALGGENHHPHFLWRRAPWPGRGCSTAQLSQKATNKPQGNEDRQRRTSGVPPRLRSRIPGGSGNSTACRHKWGPGQVRRASTACCDQFCPREAPTVSGQPLGRPSVAWGSVTTM